MTAPSVLACSRSPTRVDDVTSVWQVDQVAGETLGEPRDEPTKRGGVQWPAVDHHEIGAVAKAPVRDAGVAHIDEPLWTAPDGAEDLVGSDHG